MPVDLQSDELGFPELGRIRLGATRQKTRGDGTTVDYPVEMDHFVMKDAPSLIPLYGEQPKELLVTLPYTERDRNFRVYYEEFRRGGLYCQGDGDRITWMVDPGESGEVVVRDGMAIRDFVDGDTPRTEGEVIPCPGYDRDMYPRCANCRLRGLLFVIVRDPRNPRQFANSRLGYYRISTGSVRNVRDYLTPSLNTIARLASYMGRDMSGIPLILRRVPGNVTFTNDKGQRGQTTKYFLQFEADPAWVQAAGIAMADNAIAGPNGEQPQLPEIVDSSGVVVGEDLYTPEDQDDTDVELEHKIANIGAMRDDLPNSKGEGLDRVRELLGDAYDGDGLATQIRDRLGLRRGQKAEWNLRTWGALLDIVIGYFTGEPAN